MDKNKSNREFDKPINSESERLNHQESFQEMEGNESLFVESEWEDFIQKDEKKLDKKISANLLRDINKWRIASAESRRKKLHRTFGYATAAVALLFAIFGLRFYMLDRSTEVVTQSVVEHAYVQLINMSEIDTIVHLPDGSVARLGANSQLRYLRHFTNEKREISLRGKAQFEVSKDPDRPFMVDCKGLITVALGTVFTVNERKMDTEVCLLEGKVKVYLKGNDKFLSFLQPGDKVSYQSQIGKWNYIAYKPEPLNRKPAPVNQENLVDESNEKLAYEVEGNEYVFKNVTFQRMISSLETLYNCQIVYPKDISNNNMYVHIDTSQSIHTVLQNIALLQNLDLKEQRPLEFVIVAKK